MIRLRDTFSFLNTPPPSFFVFCLFFFLFFFYEIKYFRVLFVLKFVNANMDDAHPDIQLFIWCCTQFVNLIYFWLNLLLVKLTCCTGSLGGSFLRGFDIVEQLCCVQNYKNALSEQNKSLKMNYVRRFKINKINKKLPLSHHGHTKLCAFRCLILIPQILNLRSRNQILGKLYRSQKLHYFRGSRFSQCFILSTTPHYS